MYARIISVVLLASAVQAMPGVLERRAACNADNCLRAVRSAAAKPGLSQAADCRSFLRPTVTPCTTVTSFATVTAAPVVQVGDNRVIEVLARDASTCPASAAYGSAIPNYASVCSSAARYSSACACAGFTAPGVFTLSSTSTITATSTVTVAPSCTNFILQATSGPLTGQYVQYARLLTISTTDPGRTTRWSVNSQNQIVSTDGTGSIWASILQPASSVAVLDPNSIPTQTTNDGEFNGERHAVLCDVPKTSDGYSGTIACRGWTGYGYSSLVFQICPNTAQFILFVDGVLDTDFDSSCQEVGFAVIPAC